MPTNELPAATNGLSRALILTFVQWRHMDGVVWDVGPTWARGALWAVFGLGWLVALAATFLIDHFELFGLRQVIDCWKSREHVPAVFQERWLYRIVRHPLMLGFLTAFWAAPTMTAGRFFFAAVTATWVLIAVRVEERTLVALHGEEYEQYRRRVPALIPRLIGR